MSHLEHSFDGISCLFRRLPIAVTSRAAVCAVAAQPPPSSTRYEIDGGVAVTSPIGSILPAFLSQNTRFLRYSSRNGVRSCACPTPTLHRLRRPSTYLLARTAGAPPCRHPVAQ